jgi:peptidoglycan DL-endopeptidase CwlO
MRKLRADCGTVRPLLWPVKGRWGLILAAAACFCLLATCLLATPASGIGPSTVASLSADDAQLAAKQRAAVLDLYSLDARLATAHANLSALKADAVQLEGQRATLTQALRLARFDARLCQQRLAQRLRFIYDHGTTSSLDVVMGAKSLGDAMTELDDFNRVAASNAGVLLQVRSAQHHMTYLRRTLTRREQALAATTRAASATVAELARLRSERVDYLGSLAGERAYDASRIAALNAEAEAAVRKTETLIATPMAQTIGTSMEITAAPATLVVNGRQLTVSVTAYSLPGHTASGLPVGWGIAAVDPSVIPLGTHFMVPGYGEAVAADTGSAIIGSRIDIWFPTLAQADAWGRRTVTISIG